MCFFLCVTLMEEPHLWVTLMEEPHLCVTLMEEPHVTLPLTVGLGLLDDKWGSTMSRNHGLTWPYLDMQL